MNDLIVLKNENEQYEITISRASLNNLGQGSTHNEFVFFSPDEDQYQGINLFDVQFDSKVKKADKPDYLFSIFSGAFSAAVDQIVVGKTDLSKIKEIKKSDIIPLLSRILEFGGFSNDVVEEFTAQFEKYSEELGETFQRASSFKKMAVDFRNSLSGYGLAFCIFSALTGLVIGKTDDGKLGLCIDSSAYIYDGKTKTQKVVLGCINWFLIQVEA